MKIADGLELIKSLGREKARLERLAEQEGWAYKSQDPNSKWEPTFDLNENRATIRDLDKRMRKLSRAINIANNSVDLLGINDTDYSDWL
ncbi:hypothetical protein ES703_119834 [subsurface metagenome]